MTAALLAAYPEVFRAGAAVAGLPYGAAGNVQEAFQAMFQGRSRPAREWGDLVRAASPHAGPWPRLSIWHGEADTTVRPSAAEALALQWSDVHGLAAAPAAASTAGGRPYSVWRAPDGEPVVELHLLPGMGHGTPLAAGGPEGVGRAGPFLLEVGVSSSLEIARFWGLAEAAPAAAEGLSEPAPPALPRYAPPPHPAAKPVGMRTAARGPAVDVGDAIATALRSAGLMK
jgi:feruloyl esterase